MRTKLKNRFRGKEGKKRKRKNRYVKLNRGRWRRFIYIKYYLKGGKKTVGKANKRINVEKIIGIKN